MHTNTTAPETAPRFDSQQFANLLSRIKHEPILHGIAAPPSVIDRIRLLEASMPRRPDALCGLGVSYIVDARIKSGQAEVFYSAEAWRARCAEQREYELTLCIQAGA